MIETEPAVNFRANLRVVGLVDDTDGDSGRRRQMFGISDQS